MSADFIAGHIYQLEFNQAIKSGWNLTININENYGQTITSGIF